MVARISRVRLLAITAGVGAMPDADIRPIERPVLWLDSTARASR